jgi:hypothetical protein
VPAAAAAAAPQTPATALQADDPRVAWAAQNAGVIKQRSAAEAAKKAELLAAAKEHLDKTNKVGGGGGGL